MTYGLTSEQIDFLEKSVLGPLRGAGAEIYIFGSRARGDHQKFSDVDLLVVTKTDLSQLIGRITEELENSNFPFKVDIVESLQLADSYRPSVDLDKIRL